MKSILLNYQSNKVHRKDFRIHYEYNYHKGLNTVLDGTPLIKTNVKLWALLTISRDQEEHTDEHFVDIK